MSSTPALGGDVSRTKRRRSRSVPRTMILYLVPALVFYVFVVIVPSGQGVVYAFTDWDGLSQNFDWVGFEQFAKLLRDPTALGAVWHTLVVAVGITIIQNVIGLLLALGVNTRIKSRNILRVFFFAPAVIAPVATAYLWQYLLAPNGPVNGVLGAVGLSSLQQNWLGDPSIVLGSIIAFVVWQFAGYSMVIFLAGLEAVPTEILEAAELDGAGPVRRFWSVVRPLLAPAITVNLMLSIIGGLKLFDQVYILTGGGPADTSQTISTLIYKNAFIFNDFAYSIAMAVVLTIFVAVISGFQYFGLSKQGR